MVKIFYDDHNPAHFHAEYGEHEALVNINTLAILSGSLPARALGLVTEWSSLHQQELRRLGTAPSSSSHRERSSPCREAVASQAA